MSLGFAEQLETAYRSFQGDPLQLLRSKSWERYEQIGIPSKRSEQYRYVKVPLITEQTYSFSHSLDSLEIDSYILPECKDSLFVFINGTYVEKYSNTSALDRVVALPLSQASKSYQAFLTNQWSQSLKREIDPFAAINGALCREGLFLLIPPNCVVERPIQILHIVNTGHLPAIVQPRIHLFAGKNSELSLLFQTDAVDSSHFGINQVCEMSLDEGAKVQMTQVSRSLKGWHFEALRASLKASSSLNSICLTTGSRTTRYDYRIALTGENAEADLKGISYLEGKSEAHLNILMEHQAAHCRSNQEFKSVLKGASRSSFEGKIYVHQEAQKTEAYQKNSNILLDDLAIANSKPNLEIFADDVKASHGATVGQLDPEQLFYLKTRGFSDQEAKEILIRGFCSEIISQICIPSVKNKYGR